jgi:hypothetical protein
MYFPDRHLVEISKKAGVILFGAMRKPDSFNHVLVT